MLTAALFELRRTFRFEAAHRLPHVAPEHKCARLHGHSFEVEVVVRGALDARLGWVMDYADLKAAAGPIIDELDHRYLNELDGLTNPTSEVVCVWLWQRLAPRLTGLYALTLRETCTTACTYYGPRGGEA
ncbi:MAG: 6-carboxytetrahydropterin synthase QueD [Myxococcales bacterium]|nr:6-carboxytetrahydropterin synthase QueD [Myxococcales bacterium]